MLQVLPFSPVSNIIVAMGCGGVNVEYLLRDTQGVDETTVAQILASNQLAHAVQVSTTHDIQPLLIT